MYAPRAAASLLREKKFVFFPPSFFSFFSFLLRRATLGGETHKISASSIRKDSYTKFVYNNDRVQRRGCDLWLSLHSLFSRAINRNVRINIILLMAVRQKFCRTNRGESVVCDELNEKKKRRWHRCFKK